MKTTLNKIREHQPCKDGWETLLEYLGKTKPDDEPLSLLTILDSNGLDETLWCFRAVDGFEKEKLLLGLGFARAVEHLMPAESKKALDVFDRYANGLPTQEEFDVAREAASDASHAAHAAWAAAGAADAAAAAYAAARAAWAALASARGDVYAAVADAAADAAARAVAARAADADARAAAYDAAFSNIQAKQETQLRELLERTCTQL